MCSSDLAAGLHNITLKRAQHEFRRKFFSLRVAETWNNLPNTVKDVNNVYKFKREFRKFKRDAAV